MKRSSFLFALFSFIAIAAISTHCPAQRAGIRGQVLDSSNNALALATASLFRKGGSTKPVTRTYTNKEGFFYFGRYDTGSYEILISSAGYLDNRVAVTLSSADTEVNLPVTRLAKAALSLKEVKVTAFKRLVDAREDGISYNAEADPMANADKLIDLLRKAPLISVDANDNVEINGQSNFKVLLNGRETSMFARDVKQALRSFPGSLVKRIDIITNPSAKYDAEGIGGIINIITKKKVAGYNGTLTADINTQTYRGADGSFNFKYGKIGLTALASTGGNHGLVFTEEEGIEAKVASTFFQRYSSGSTRQFNQSPQLNAELSYEADSLNTFSFYGSADRGSRSDLFSNTFRLIPAAGASPVESKFTAETRKKNPGMTGGVDYIRKFKGSSERELSIKVFGSFAKEEINNASQQLSGANNRFILNESTASDQQITLQSDYIHLFKGGQKLESGIKFIFRRATSDYESFQKFNAADPYALNFQNSDQFSYRQDVYSMYTSYSFRVKVFNFRTGLRVEHTEVDGDFTSSQTRVVQQYTHLVPNLLIASRLKNGANLSFGYSLRLSRPYIQLLNPFADNTDSLTVYKGNPALEPQVFHNTSLQYRFSKGKLFANISLGNSYSRSYIVYGYTFNPADGVSTFTSQNNGTSNRVYLTTAITAKPNEKWNLSINGGASYFSIKSLTGILQRNSGFTGQLGYNTSYTVTPAFAVTHFFNYYFPVVLLQGTRDSYFAYGVGARYQLFKNKVTLSAYGNNLFNKDGLFKRITLFEDAAITRIRTQYVLFRGIGLNISWNFGKLSDGVSKKRGVSNTDLL